MSDAALKHVEHLSVKIGPRPSASPAEEAAHDYVHAELARLNYQPRRESFVAPTSIYLPFAIAMGLMLLAWLLFDRLGSVGALAATALGAVATASVILDLLVRDAPLRWFVPTGRSQNVIAVARPAVAEIDRNSARPRGETRHKLVIAAHVDTHRTPLFWRTQAAFRAYRLVATLGVLALLASQIMFVVGTFAYSDGLRAAARAPAVVFAVVLAMVLQAEFSRHSVGANDNASGVGVLLALAARLRAEPLPASEVWLVATGCEEVGAFGMRDFVARHRDELRDAVVLVIDNVAGRRTGAVYLRSEMLLQTLRAPADLLAVADQLASEHPELKAYSARQVGAFTDAAPALLAGIRALAFVGYNRRGWIPHWHHPDDIFDRIDPAPLDQTERFVWELMKRCAVAQPPSS